MENVLFKVSFPAEFHGQTSVEASIELHEDVANRLEEIERIEILTQDAGHRIIDKRGILRNPADRDHCIQYMTAIGLIFGDLTAEDYEDERAADPRIDQLRDKMIVKEDPQFTRDYHDPDKRAIANSVQVFFKDSTHTDKIVVEYPLGHERRRKEAIPLLEKKFKANLSKKFRESKINEIFRILEDQEKLEQMSVDSFMDLFHLE